MRRTYLAMLAFLVGVLLSMAVNPTSSQAGHQYGGGDCWRPGTALLCRTNFYYFDPHGARIRVLDWNLNNSQLWNAAKTGCTNWSSASGSPVYCTSVALSNYSYVYFARNDGISAPNGVTQNCNAAGQCTGGGGASNPMNVHWSNIFVPLQNVNYGSLMISVSAHEIGHSLGLNHHSSGALMTQGSSLVQPNSIDIGPLPACSITSGGVRCIYNGN
jgi:hypothetical protein